MQILSYQSVFQPASLSRLGWTEERTWLNKLATAILLFPAVYFLYIYSYEI